jgi:hypothetical protein
MAKKKPTTKKVAPVIEEHIESEPAEELPVRQVEETQTEQPGAETAPTIEPVQEAEPEKSAEIEPQPVVEVVVESTPAPAPIQPSKPKPLTMTALHADIEALRKIVDEQSILIKQLMEAPARQRKPPTSNGKVSILDTKTGKIYPSKNNVYQSLLKAGELADLVKQGVFGADPAKNSFGCYNLFRAYPGRFVEIKPEEIKV